MKTRAILKILCSLCILTLAPKANSQGVAQAAGSAKNAARTQQDSSIRSLSEDPIGAWIEKNAAKYGLFIDAPLSNAKPNVRTLPGAKSSLSISTKLISPISSNVNLSAPSPMVQKPIAPHAPTAAPVVSPKEQDAIEAFFVNRVFDVEAGDQGPTSPPASNATASSVPKVSSVRVPEVDVEKKIFAPPAAAALASSPAAQISAVMVDLEYSPKCSSFASAEGFGVWGKAIIKEIVDGGANTLLQGTDDLRRACPNYDFLSIREKSHVWVNVFASMSFLESSCDPRKLGKGPNGTAAGLLQLHRGHERKASPGCDNFDSKAPISSLMCGISIIETQIKRTNLLFSRDTHFGVLRPQGDLVRTAKGLKRVVKARIVVGGIRELPMCQRQ